MREPPRWYRELLGRAPVIRERCGCGATTERLAVVADPFADWRRDHVCAIDPEGPADEAPVGNDAPLQFAADDPADPIGFRLYTAEEEA